MLCEGQNLVQKMNEQKAKGQHLDYQRSILRKIYACVYNSSVSS